MYFKIANRSLACSTLVMGDISNNSSLELFIKSLKDGFDVAEADESKDIVWSSWEDDHKGWLQFLDGYEISDFAFIMATTEPRQSVAEGYMKALGFTSTPKKVYNNKNETKVNFHFIAVPELLANIKAFEESKKETLAEKKVV